MTADLPDRATDGCVCDASADVCPVAERIIAERLAAAEAREARVRALAKEWDAAAAVLRSKGGADVTAYADCTAIDAASLRAALDQPTNTGGR